MYRLKLEFILLLFMVFAGCAAPGHIMYYWGDYSTTLYEAKKYPSDASLQAHQQALESIVDESRKRNLPVPPGVYAELGYMHLRQNKNQQATGYFRMERELYPEAAIFMERLEKAASLRDKKSAANPVIAVQPGKKEEVRK